MLCGKRPRSPDSIEELVAETDSLRQQQQDLFIDKAFELLNKTSDASGSVDSSIFNRSNVTVNTLNKEQEEDMIRELKMQSRNQLRIDPLKELEEALMDRTTAQMR